MSPALRALCLLVAIATPGHGLLQCNRSPNGTQAMDLGMHGEVAEAAAEVLVAEAASRRARPVVPSGKPLVVLIFGDNRVRNILVNWMAGMHGLGVDNYEVICMDHELEAFMLSIGRPCTSIAEIGKRIADVWEFRLRVLAGLLANGTDVVVSDADAVWLQNPFDFLGSGDIVASRGKMPTPVVNKLGATVCMGWVFFRGTPAVARFMRSEVLERFFVNDDQVAINNALVANGLHFPSRLVWEESTNVDEGRTKAVGVGGEGGAGVISVRLLDHQRFQRKCNPSTFRKAYVAHCLPKGVWPGNQTKEEMTRDLGLWFLNDAWETVPRDGRFHEWIGRVACERH